MEYTLRNCTYNDVDLILKLKELGLKWYIQEIYGWDEEIQRKKTIHELNKNIEDMKIIVVNSQDVGVTTFQKNEEFYCIGLTLIHPDYQNKGIATSILSKYIQSARQDKKRVIIKTYKENPAKRLYERMGFKIYNEDSTHIYLEIDFSK